MIHLEVVDHDQLFHSLKYPPVLVNDIDVTQAEGKEKLNQLLYTRYEGDTLDVMPSCDCGALRGQTNAGIRCDECGSLCASVTEKPLESMLWIAAPKGIHAMINPQVWNIMSKNLTIPGCHMLKWLTDPLYQPTTARGVTMAEKLQNLELPRGLNSFIENFDRIMEVLFKNNIPRGGPRAREDFRIFIDMYKDKFFPKHVPVPSRLGFIVENTNTGTYADTSMALALDAIRSVSSINTSITSMRHNRLESRVVRAIDQLGQYYRSFATNSLGKKTGWLRKHVFGSRLHFTGRAVISSMSENHAYDECHLPWGLAVQLMKVHLSNKLLKRGYTPNQIQELFYKHAMKYSELLDELFKELIEECPHKGIPIILQRNPTLVRGSAQQLFVTKVIDDPRVYTIRMSVLALKAPNADFDGDELNLMLILDEDMFEHLSRLAPHTGAMDLKKPGTVSKNLSLPPPVVATIGNWLSGD